MSLPDDVSWSLRNDGSSVYLDESLPIGDQVGSTVQIVSFSVTPETALHNSTVTLSWEVRNATQISIREVYSDGRYGQWYPNLSASGSLDVITPESSGETLTVTVPAALLTPMIPIFLSASRNRGMFLVGSFALTPAMIGML